MKIGAGKIIGTALFVAGVAAIWLWPKPKAEVKEEEVVSSGVTRLRPVFNTSLTTVLGMMPLVADPFYSAMAVTIMCGLAFATLLTMIVVPVNYALLYRVKRTENAA